jgi:hypothetical protein
MFGCQRAGNAGADDQNLAAEILIDNPARGLATIPPPWRCPATQVVLPSSL